MGSHSDYIMHERWQNVIKSVNTRVETPKHTDSGTLRLLLAPVDGAGSFSGQPASTHYSITYACLHILRCRQNLIIFFTLTTVASGGGISK